MTMLSIWLRGYCRYVCEHQDIKDPRAVGAMCGLDQAGLLDFQEKNKKNTQSS